MSVDCEHDFKTLKGALLGSNIMVFPDDSGRFILDTDASLETIGAFLLQAPDGRDRVITYCSRILSRQERN